MACREQLSLLWLTGMIQPDHNSLWRFWRDHKKALRAVFKHTVQVAVRTGAVGLALHALDGTKIQSAASTPQGWSKAYMEKVLAPLDAALDDLELKVVEDNADVAAPGYRLPAGLAERQALREPNAPATPKGGRSRCARTPRWFKPCARRWPGR